MCPVLISWGQTAKEGCVHIAVPSCYPKLSGFSQTACLEFVLPSELCLDGVHRTEQKKPDLNGAKSILKMKPSGEESSHIWKESQVLFAFPVWTQVKRNFVENTTLSASTDIETTLEAHLKLQGWTMMASFENMGSHSKDRVTSGHTQK